jgi:hypothetical protein
MQKNFKHPLARKATTAKLRLRDGGEGSLLLILTTMELDESAKRFSRKNYDRLNDSARNFLAETEGLAGYAILNRPKEWDD